MHEVMSAHAKAPSAEADAEADDKRRGEQAEGQPRAKDAARANVSAAEEHERRQTHHAPPPRAVVRHLQDRASLSSGDSHMALATASANDT